MRSQDRAASNAPTGYEGRNRRTATRAVPLGIARMSGQVWAVNTLGGYFYSRQLSNVLRMNVQPLTKFRQFADVHDAAQQGKRKGNTFTWDVVSDVAQVGQVLIETNTMPETNLTITQGTLTITEAGNSIP